MKETALKIYCFILLAALASCRDNHILREAEALLETNPAAADSLLTSMPAPTSNRDRAWYAVLKTQADYKQYKSITSDSLILTATSYYGIHRKNYRSALAWYTQGCVYTELHDDVSAIDAYLKALDLFPDTLVRYYSICQHNLGNRYLNCHMYPESEYYIIRSLKRARQIKDSATISYCCYNLGRLYLFDGRFKESEDYLMNSKTDSLLQQVFRVTSLLHLSKIYLHYYNEPDTALYYVNRYIKESNNSTSAGYSIKADIFYSCGLLDSAYHYYLKSLDYAIEPSTACNTYSHLPELSILFGDTAKTQEYIEAYSNSIFRLNESYANDSILAVNIRYNKSLYENGIKQAKSYRIGFISLLVIFIIAFVFFITSRNKKVSLSFNELLTNASRQFKLSKSYNMIISFESSNIEPSNKEITFITNELDICFDELFNTIKQIAPSINNIELHYCVLRYLGISRRVSMSLIQRSMDYAGKLKYYIKRKLPTNIYDSFFR